MDHAVTAFCRHRGEILLVRRSRDAVDYPGRWAGVSAYFGVEPDDPLAEAERLVRETFGPDTADLVRSGAPITVPGDEERSWLVHPFLFDVEIRPSDTTDRFAASEWAPATTIRDREAVPMLWETYCRIAPSLETLRTDEVHGASWLSVRALEVLRDEAATADTRAELAELARELVDVRPGMVAIGNRVNRVVAEFVGDGGGGEDGDGDGEGNENGTASSLLIDELHDRSVAAIERAVTADRDAARAAAARLEPRGSLRDRDGPVVTLSRSETVLAALSELDSCTAGAGPDVIVGESRPDREGVAVAETLAESDVGVTLAADLALPWLLARRDAGCVLVGADTIDPGGGVYNKAGTYGLALAADRAGVPVVVVASTAKVAPGAGFRQERSDPAAVYAGSSGVDVATPRFDRTPPDLVTAIVTEEGVRSPDDVEEIATRHREHAAWLDESG